jgi:Cu-Zn family superoxide dismutase
MVPHVTLERGTRSLLDADRSATMMHAGKDDYASDPASDSGDRIDCGRIVR